MMALYMKTIIYKLEFLKKTLIILKKYQKIRKLNYHLSPYLNLIHLNYCHELWYAHSLIYCESNQVLFGAQVLMENQ